MVKKNINDINLTSYDDLFGNQEDIVNQSTKDNSNKVIEIPIDDIENFPNHPFKVLINDEMIKMIESVKDYGILVPTIVRPNPNGNGYQMISGHRHKKATELVELNTMPVIVKNYSDDEATIIMVDSNIQRENVLPSEKAFAYKMKYEALKNQGKRLDLTSCQLGTKYNKTRTDEAIAINSADSARNIQRYIRLTNLIEPLLNLVDDKRISFNPAVELSFLIKDHQEILYNVIQQEEATPSLSQSQKLKQLSQLQRFNEDVVFSILTEEKPNQKEKLVIKSEKLDKYFPKKFTPKQKEELVISLVAKWYKNKTKGQER